MYLEIVAHLYNLACLRSIVSINPSYDALNSQKLNLILSHTGFKETLVIGVLVKQVLHNKTVSVITIESVGLYLCCKCSSLTPKHIV